ncbi:MAG: ATP cone domain-containing protein [Candidatus Natronoplasma sp.]
MKRVSKEGRKYPFSKGILASSLDITGLPLDEIYELVKEIDRELKGVEEIPSKEIKEKVREKLLERGLEKEERFYRVSRQLRYLDRPLLIVVGGGPGVGKSTLSAELGHRLDITRIIGSDTIREIMRTMVSRELIPTLYESTFMTDQKVKAPFVKDRLIYGFDQQVSVVSMGVRAVIDRGIKEGLNTIINGVHIVPGYLDLDEREDDCFVFQYVLEVPDLEEHMERFVTRAQGSRRDPDRYINRIEKIREIQEYTIKRGKANGAKIIKNVSMEKTIREMMDDIITNLEPVINDG